MHDEVVHVADEAGEIRGHGCPDLTEALLNGGL